MPNINKIPAMDTIVHILRQRVVTMPESQAFSFWQDGEQESDALTYAELDRRATALAVGLLDRFAPGSRLLLAHSAGTAFIETFFACLYARIIAVPVALPAPGRGCDALEAVRQRTSAQAVLTSTAAVRLLDRPEVTPAFRKALLMTDDGSISQGIGHEQLPLPKGSDIAFLQCTSGSTSQPKAVIVQHRNVTANSRVIQQCFGHSAESQGVIWLPHYHDMGLIGGIVQPVAVGFPVVLMPPAAFVQRPSRWLRAISKVGATTSGGPPFAYSACAQRFTDADLEGLDLSTWSAAFVGAEPIGGSALQLFVERFAGCGFRSQSLLPCYGLAEATLMVSGGPGGLRELTGLRGGHTTQVGIEEAVLVSCGMPAPGHQVAIVDAQTSCMLSEGTEGEIWVRGPSVAAGYWEDSVETQHTFGALLADTVDEPFLRTGDLGFIVGGELVVTGRAKDLIIVRGKNLHPQDIEESTRRVIHEHGDLCAAAFGVQVNGNEELIVVQEIPSKSHDPAGWVGRIQETIIQEHGIRCHDIVLVRRKTIPRTTSGKVMRTSCRQLYLARELETRRADRTESPKVD